MERTYLATRSGSVDQARPPHTVLPMPPITNFLFSGHLTEAERLARLKTGGQVPLYGSHPSLSDVSSFTTVARSSTLATSSSSLRNKSSLSFSQDLSTSLKGLSSPCATSTLTSGQDWAQNDVSMETWIVQEYCDLGPMTRAVTNKAFQKGSSSGQINMLFVALRARDIAQGMAYLHALNVCHGDLKCENVLLAQDPQDPMGCQAKVADFGLSRAIAAGRSHLSTQTYGTVTHMSPELLLKGRLGPKVDVYSFGIMMWEMVSGLSPYAGMTAGEVIQKVVVQQYRPGFSDRIPQDYCQLAEICWAQDPKKRPPFRVVAARLEEIVCGLMQPQVMCIVRSVARTTDTSPGPQDQCDETEVPE